MEAGSAAAVTSPRHVPRDVLALQVDDPAVQKQLQLADAHRRSNPPKSENVSLAPRPGAKRSSRRTPKPKIKPVARQSVRQREGAVSAEEKAKPPPKRSAPEPSGPTGKLVGRFTFTTPNGVLEGEIPPGAHFHVHLGDS